MRQKFITAGVNQRIDLVLQLLIWALVASIPCEKDYLQVFSLEPGTVNGRPVQKIKLSQEIPPYEHVCSYYCKNSITEKLFMIDEADHTVLLLSEEY